MSDFDFIAWSLVAGGITAILTFGSARVAAVRGGKPPHVPKPVELAMSVIVSLAMGAVTMRLVVHQILHLQLPRWIGFLDGGMFLSIGLWHLASTRRDATGYSSTRTLGYFFVGMGVLLLVLELL